MEDSILQNPDSLCAQLLRAKYGSVDSLLHAKEGPGISYTWRSIVRGLQALKKGLIWRVGDGTRIKIWEDPWYPMVFPEDQSLLGDTIY